MGLLKIMQGFQVKKSHFLGFIPITRYCLALQIHFSSMGFSNFFIPFPRICVHFESTRKATPDGKIDPLDFLGASL